jgi:hypothetical protein
MVLAPFAKAQQPADDGTPIMDHAMHIVGIWQRGTLVATGKVVGPHSEPQAGVPIQVSGPQGEFTSFTDADGLWSVYNLPAGTYHVQPPKGMTTATKKPTTFTVTQTGLLGTLFGAEQKPAYTGEIMLLGEDFKQQ